MARGILFILGFVLLLGGEIGKVYFIMPFPGSQQNETIEVAYFLYTYINYFRIIGVLLIAFPVYHFIHYSKVWIRSVVISLLIFWLIIVFVVNFKMQADKMFYQPKSKKIVTVAENNVPVKQLVLGVHRNGESKAYPIEIIGYHHQVCDTIGDEPILITYCTVCRTGRVFSPILDGHDQVFRLVGMDHFNAMFEDSRTGSWWRQVNGEAIIGPMKGRQLIELPAEQMTLTAWISRYPDTKILQPDSAFIEEYQDLSKYDEGKKKGRLEGTDSVSWGDKSWVIGVQIGMDARAYDWIEMLEERVVNDTLRGTFLVVVLESDSATFHVWSKPDSLKFSLDENLTQLTDDKTGSKWDWNGKCVAGKLTGAKLEYVQSYQEYWHSWKTFRPQTTQYKIK